MLKAFGFNSLKVLKVYHFQAIGFKYRPVTLQPGLTLHPEDATANIFSPLAEGEKPLVDMVAALVRSLSALFSYPRMFSSTTI